MAIKQRKHDHDRPLANPLSGGTLVIRRYPEENGDLMGWDAADEYLIDYCHTELGASAQRVLVADDNFGALSCAFSSFDADRVHFSAAASASASQNLQMNRLASPKVVEWQAFPVDRFYDLVLMRMPKSVRLLQDHCYQLREQLNPGALLVVAVMDKYLSKSMLETLSNCIGKTHTTLGKKKARLVVSEFEPHLDVSPPGLATYFAEPFDIEVISYPGVFAESQLDIGTRFLLEQFDRLPRRPGMQIADLACGTGVLGLVAAKLVPDARIVFYDDSSIAIRSARAGVEHNFPNDARFEFRHGDGLVDCAPASLDLVLCNPPFHLGQQQDTRIAERLFQQARVALKQTGELWVVGNRHLGYHARLKRLFGQVEMVASNRKFVVLVCRQT